jgi:hypothetical protein
LCGQALNGAVRPPARLQQEVHPALLVLGIEAGVVGAARAAGIREDEDALGPAHEGVGIGQRLVGGARSKPLAAIRQSHQTRVRPVISATASVPKQMIASSAGTIGGSAQQFQRLGLDPQRLLAVNRIARLIDHRRERSLPSSSQ